MQQYIHVTSNAKILLQIIYAKDTRFCNPICCFVISMLNNSAHFERDQISRKLNSLIANAQNDLDPPPPSLGKHETRTRVIIWLNEM